jgi:hypothetical protein
MSRWGIVGAVTPPPPPPMFENFVFFARRFMDSFEKFPKEFYKNFRRPPPHFSDLETPLYIVLVINKKKETCIADENYHSISFDYGISLAMSSDLQGLFLNELDKRMSNNNKLDERQSTFFYKSSLLVLR